jgi:ABC-2 type transport system ATP-binding protein
MDRISDKDLERSYIVEARDLTKSFEGRIAVNSMDMDIPDGVILGLIGPSGCGKTTTIRLMTGIYQPTEGDIRVFGKSPTKFSNSDRENIGYLLQQNIINPDLTVWENLNFVASFYGVRWFRSGTLNRLLEFVELTEDKHKIAQYLSGGMKRRLGLAAALVHNPKLLFLDEPTAGIDPILRAKFWDYFKKLQAEGHTLIITTQYVGEAQYCDLVGIMSNGELLMVDTPQELRRKAFSGEVVVITTKERIEFVHRKKFEDLPFGKARVFPINDHEVEIVVPEANSAIPHLIKICEQEGLDAKKVEKKDPPFDEVFIRLIEMQVKDE